MKIKLPQEILTCINILNEQEKECFVIGGAVRDALLNRPVHDYDLSTNATPVEMHSIFSNFKVLDTGIKHGTVTVVINHVHIEITTYRIEQDYFDHRHPSTVSFTNNLKEDCARRDFTINALAYHPLLGIQDHFHGIDDLNDHIIRAINDPSDRFNEDALRILRGLRLSSELNFEIEEKTAKAIHLHKEDLNLISIERIREEFFRILLADEPSKILIEYKDVFAIFFPEINALSDAFIKKIDYAPKDISILLAILLSNNKKTDIYSRMKLSNNESKKIKKLLMHKNMSLQTKYDIRYLLHIFEDDYESYISFRETIDNKLDTKKVRSMIHTCLEDHDCTSLRNLCMHGDDLVQMNIQGKDIQIILNKCLDAVMYDEVENDFDALTKYVKTLL